jgi:hypothetical protein
VDMDVKILKSENDNNVVSFVVEMNNTNISKLPTRMMTIMMIMMMN